MGVSEKRKMYLAKWRGKHRERLNTERRAWAKEWRKLNPEKAKEHDKQQRKRNKAKRNEYSAKYYETHKDDKAFKTNRNKRTLRYYYKNKEKAYARNIANKAIRTGKMEKKTNCECCGQETILEKHHFDYSKPLKVTWLCKKCHTFIERACDDWEAYLKVSQYICEVCWTSSYAPCPKSTKGSHKDQHGKGYIVCQMCRTDEFIRSLPSEKEILTIIRKDNSPTIEGLAKAISKRIGTNCP